MSWSLYTDGKCKDEPIDGRWAEFEVVETIFDKAERAAQDINEAFVSLSRRGADDAVLIGEAGNTLQVTMSDFARALAEIPRVAGEVERIFHTHAERLKELERAADEALARAQTAWRDKGTAESGLAQVEGELSWVESQIVSPWQRVIRDLDPAEEEQQERYENQRWALQQERSRRQAAVDSAQGRVDAEVTTWEQLRQAECDRNDLTRSALAAIDLGILKDSWWDNFVDSLPSIDWADILWTLHDVLSTALLVLGVVALFVGGPFLATAIFVLALTKLATDSVLLGTGWEHPDQPGRTMTAGEWVISAIGTAAAGASFAHAVKGLKMSEVVKAPHLKSLGNAVKTGNLRPGTLLRSHLDDLGMKVTVKPGQTMFTKTLPVSTGVHATVGSANSGLTRAADVTHDVLLVREAWNRQNLPYAGWDVDALNRTLGVLGVPRTDHPTHGSLSGIADAARKSVGLPPTLSGPCRPVVTTAVPAP